MATTLSPDTKDYTLSLDQMTMLASEFLGKTLSAAGNDGGEGHTVEFEFTEGSAAANAKAFRDTLNTCFVARVDPGPDI